MYICCLISMCVMSLLNPAVMIPLPVFHTVSDRVLWEVPSDRFSAQVSVGSIFKL